MHIYVIKKATFTHYQRFLASLYIFTLLLFYYHSIVYLTLEYHSNDVIKLKSDHIQRNKNDYKTRNKTVVPKHTNVNNTATVFTYIFYVCLMHSQCQI